MNSTRHNRCAITSTLNWWVNDTLKFGEKKMTFETFDQSDHPGHLDPDQKECLELSCQGCFALMQCFPASWCWLRFLGFKSDRTPVQKFISAGETLTYILPRSCIHCFDCIAHALLPRTCTGNLFPPNWCTRQLQVCYPWSSIGH